MALDILPLQGRPGLWGPPPEEVQMFGLPLELFNKSSAINRIANFLDDREVAAMDEEGFRVEKSARVAALEKTKRKQETYTPGPRGGGGRGGHPGQRGRGGRGRGGGGFGFRREVLIRTASRDITELRVLHRFNLPDFAKLSHPPAVGGEDLHVVNRLRYFNSALLDPVNPKKPVPLVAFPDVEFVQVPVSLDPVVRELARSIEGEKPVVFATDVALATLMNASKSGASWDLEFRLWRHFTFIESRPESRVDTWWVDENAVDNVLTDLETDPKKAIDNFTPLGEESTLVSRYFAEMSRVKQFVPSYKANSSSQPVQDGKRAPMVSYRYRLWTVDAGKPTEYRLVVRSEVDAALPPAKDGAKPQYVRTFGLLERPGANWKDKLETQRGRLLATEVKNNGSKFAKWATMALLSGAEVVKFAFISRASPTDNTKHKLLRVETVTPGEVCTQTGLRLDNMWGALHGILKTVTLFAPQAGRGRLGIMKDPNSPIISLFVIPHESELQKQEGGDDDGDSESSSDESSSSDSSSSSSESSSSEDD